MSARSESKRMTNHNTPQLSRMDLASHCTAFPGLSGLNTRACTFTQLWKLQRLQNKVHRAVGKLTNFPRRTPAREFHMAFRISYTYDHIMKLYRQQAVLIQNYENANVRDIGKREARRKKYET
jgi:hypothetical protein